MKTKPKEPPKTTEAIVTSTARLTIQGQTFEMPLSELEDLYGKIGTALGKKSNVSDLEKVRKMFEDSAKERERTRPAMPPFWPTQPYIPPHNHPARPPWETPVICKDSSPTYSMNACAIQMGKHSDQRDRF